MPGSHNTQDKTDIVKQNQMQYIESKSKRNMYSVWLLFSSFFFFFFFLLILLYTAAFALEFYVYDSFHRLGLLLSTPVDCNSCRAKSLLHVDIRVFNDCLPLL